MTTEPFPANARTAPDDRIPDKQIRAMILLMEENILKTTGLIRAATFVCDYGRKFGGTEPCEAIDAVLDQALNEITNLKHLWNDCVEINRENPINV